MPDQPPIDGTQLDELDRAILRALQEQGRMSNADLARHVHLSAPAVHARVRKLEDSGVITGYAAHLDREKTGFDMLCFMQLKLHSHHDAQLADVRRVIANMPEVLECYHLTGDADYLLKVVLRNRSDLERFVRTLTPMPAVARIQTSLVLDDVKVTTSLPLRPQGPA